jgi:hypothetical protein
MLSTHYSCHILMKVEFSLQIFEKYTNNNFYENFSVGTELFQADGRTDTQIGRQADGRMGG